MTLVVLLSRGMPWRGEWQWTINWAVGTTVLTGPLVAGLTAYQTSQWRAGIAELLVPTARRPLMGLMTPLLGPLLSAVVVLLAGSAVASLISASRQPTDSFSVELILMGVLVLGVYSFIGRVIGLYFQPIVSAALSVGACYALILVSTSGLLRIFRVGGATGPLSGLRTDWRSYVGQAAWLTLVISVALIVLAARFPAARRLLFGCIAVATTCAVAGFALNPDGKGPYAVDVEGRWKCSGNMPETCLLLGNTTHLDEWSRAMASNSKPFRELGFDFPARYKQPLPSAEHRDVKSGELFFDPATVNVAEPNRDFVILSLSTPAACTEYASSEAFPIEALRARSWLASWMKSQLDPRPDSSAAPEFENWRTVTPPSSQQKWARETFAALAVCDMVGARIPDAS